MKKKLDPRRAVTAEDIIQLTAVLRRRIPKVFCSPPRPLAIGCGCDVANVIWPGKARGFDFPLSFEGRLLKATLAAWVTRPEYFAVTATPGMAQFALTGEPVGAVTVAQADYAGQQLAALYATAP